MPPPSKSSFGPTRQRGVVTILTASILMLLLLVMVLALDTGRLYLEKRKLQNIADMSALSASARMLPGECTDASVLPDALSAAEKNGFPGIGDGWGLEAFCENRRVDVTATHDAPTSLVLGGVFEGTTLLTAHASAQHDEPVAAFTVGSQLLNLDSDRLIGQLLKAIGIELPDGLRVLDENGLVTTSVLLSALGVDLDINGLAILTPSELVGLVNTQVGLIGIDELIDASLDLVSDDILRTQLSLLSDEIVSSPILGSVELHLLDVIQLAAGDDAIGRSALETAINLSDLLAISLLTGISDTGEALNLDLNIPGLATTSINIVEPPSMAIGPKGTSAKSSQIGLELSIVNLPSLPLVPSISALELNLEVASGTATLDEINCSTGETTPPTAIFAVSSQPVGVCLRALGLGRCDSNMGGGLNSANTSALTANESEVVGSRLGLNLSGLLRNLLGGLLPGLGHLLGALLGLILTPVDLVLSSVLSLLGLEVGNIEVSVESISCGVPTLVQ